MIVKTKLSEVQDLLPGDLEKVQIKGQGASSFLFAINKGRAVEISESEGELWLEFWEKSDDEDAAAVKECTVANPEAAALETQRWLK
jgi:hypothetical protein